MSISHDETVVQGPVAYMQCALLYTSSSGERRIRCAGLPHGVGMLGKSLTPWWSAAMSAHTAADDLFDSLALSLLAEEILQPTACLLCSCTALCVTGLVYILSTCESHTPTLLRCLYRVHTLAMAVVEDAASLFWAADGGATLALLAKLTVENAQQCKMEEARNKMQVRGPFWLARILLHL